MSHMSFAGTALREDVFFAAHPELAGRPLFQRLSQRKAALNAADAGSMVAAGRWLLQACFARGQWPLEVCPWTDHAAALHAEVLLREAVVLAPAAAPIRYLLGSALQLLGTRVDEALHSYRAALALDPQLEAARLGALQVLSD
eukprot:gnl/TRDRNA2_/TRDRNA2_73979_c0_seq1.p1 gnl/TRDRNA2_/TRDRNA2_73979_c0~~gnl/TRDRNA2_/TRDRNA2_73979_c0_seq1.p1  ORF type:complete len:153 (+),score=23.78 gnl/TRDRNA2_/TRDRNA2_73979_c0_seq1:31-459(+)